MEQENQEFEYKKALLKTYRESKKKQWGNNPTNGVLQSALANLLMSNKLSDSDVDQLRYFFEIGREGDLLKKIRDSGTVFRPIGNFLKDDEPNKMFKKPGLLHVIAILLEYKSPAAKDSDNLLKDESKAPSLKRCILEKYLSDAMFREIRINGDRDTIVGKLRMDEYYVQLSYIESENLKKRDTLLGLEKEHSAHKVYYDTKRDSISKTSESYLTEEILNGFQKIIITGNPGVGKSTFAKWLCYICAKRSDQPTMKTFIYVALRELNFASTTFLIDYLQEEYFFGVDVQHESLSEILKQIPNYQLVLDGFDELTLQDREVLTNAVKRYNYIVLSRPYGLIGNSLVDDVSFQIDGFSPDSIRYYIRSLVNLEKHSGKTSDELWGILQEEDNRVLFEYAHNPLMLSFITLIYLSEENPKKELGAIESTYELQNTVYEWMLKYAMGKPRVRPETNGKQIDNMTSFAFNELQTQKKYVYAANFENQNGFYQVTDFISQLGLGSKREYFRNASWWQFSFNTVVFQEFFAAKYLEDKVLDERLIVHFVSDHFFWNFSSMLFGMLAKNDANELIESTLTLLEKEYLDKNYEYYGYAYYMLLSECKASFVSRILNRERLMALILFHEKTFLDKFWKKTHAETVSRIFYKASPEKKQLFITELNQYILDIKEVPVAEMHNVALDYIFDLLPLCKEYNEQSLVEALLASLVHLTDLMATNDDPILQLTVYEYFMALLQTASPKSIRKHLDTIKALDNQIDILTFSVDVPDDYPFFYSDLVFEYYYEILSPILDEDINFPKRIAESHKAVTKAFSRRVKGVVSEVCFEEVEYLAGLLFRYCSSKKKFATREEKALLEMLDFTGNILLQLTKEKGIIEEYGQDIGRTKDFLLGCYLELNDPTYYSKMFRFMLEHHHKIYIHIPNEKAFLQYVENLLRAVYNNHTDSDALDLLIVCLEVTKLTNLLRCFYLVKEPLFNLFKKLVLEEENAFKTGKVVTSEQGRLKKQLEGIVKVFYQSFHKKYLFDQIQQAGLSQFKMVSSEIILKQISSSLNFYEKDYWAFYEELLSSKIWDMTYILPLMTNPRIFGYETNLAYIVPLFIQQFKYRDHFCDTLSALEIHKVMTLVLQLLLNLPNVSEDKIAETTALIQTILYNEHVLQQNMIASYHRYEADEVIGMEVEKAHYSSDLLAHCILAYALFYFHTTDENNHLFSLKVDEYFSNPEVSYIIFDLLMLFFEDPNGGINFEKSEKMRTVLGDNVYDQFLEVANKRQTHHTFDLVYVNQSLS